MKSDAIIDEDQLQQQLIAEAENILVEIDELITSYAKSRESQEIRK